ncbi:MAG: phage holin family protein [Propionibacteriales bacterium]|nr:phage holin family protein [Propionibacteriales bacterium]
MGFLIRLVASAGGLALAAWLLEDIALRGATTTDKTLTLIAVAVIFGVVNAVVRPVVAILSIPLYILTLGLFFIVVNALMLMLTSWICEQLGVNFRVEGFGTALLGAIIISIASWIITIVLPDPDRSSGVRQSR